MYLFSNICDTVPCLISIGVNSQSPALCEMEESCVEPAHLRSVRPLDNVLEVSFSLCFHMSVQVCDVSIFNTNLKMLFESLSFFTYQFAFS